jgi:exosortase/archaeosortase family protein
MKEITMQAKQIRATLLVICGVVLLSRLMPQLFFLILGHPAAHLSGWWLGVPSTITADGVLLMDQTLPITVTRQCSGADFLALLCGIATPFLMQPHRRRYWWAALPAALLITITANSCRIISGWYSGVWARSALSQTYWPGVHLATGIVVFFTVLVAVHGLLSVVDRRHTI